MKKPKSLIFLIFFTIWGTFKGAESLLYPAGSRNVFDFYNISFLYYAEVIFVVLGGLGLIYALWKIKPWGYILGLVWLGVGILHQVFTGFVYLTNKSLMVDIMTITQKSKGRSAENIADFVSSPIFDYTILGTAIGLIALISFFMWKLHQHRSYFLAISQDTLQSNNAQNT